MRGRLLAARGLPTPGTPTATVIILLRRKGSAFAESLARAARSSPGASALEVLDLDAVQDGAAVSVRDEGVLWQGCELTGAGALILEDLEFAWPQSLERSAVPGLDRARRSLALSALCTAAERVPAIDPPAAAHLAALPLLALSLLAERGVRVQPWSLGPPEPGAGGVRLDPLGACRGYRPAPPAEGAPAWMPEAFDGDVLSVLVVGSEIAGALAFAGAADWAAGRASGAVPAPELEAGPAAAALAAARALATQAAQVDLVRATSAVLHARPGPDWSRFEAALGPAVPRALWQHARTLETR